MMMATNTRTIFAICNAVPTRNENVPAGKKSSNTTIARMSNSVFGFCIPEESANERLPSSEMQVALHTRARKLCIG